MGPVTTASSSPRRANVTASSSAAAAARAVSTVGCPNEQSGYLPMILYSADFGTRSQFNPRSTISGPIPAQSPSVIPMHGRTVHCHQGRGTPQAQLDYARVGAAHRTARAPSVGCSAMLRHAPPREEKISECISLADTELLAFPDNVRTTVSTRHRPQQPRRRTRPTADETAV
jgi:hypothetical protein